VKLVNYLCLFTFTFLQASGWSVLTNLENTRERDHIFDTTLVRY